MPASISMTADQTEVIAFLSDPSSFPSRPLNVQRIETHGAQVFLTDTEVFKIKRAVSYSYMDFSTLEKRHAACARELHVNVENAPTIYKRICAIKRGSDGRLTFDGAGTVVEWAVVMARFREGDVLANRVDAAPLTPDEAKALADAVYQSHARAPVVAEPPAEASIQRIAKDVLGALAPLFDTVDHEPIADLARRLTAWIGRVGPILQRRISERHVRRCHGDLHLANIVFLDGKPTLFDAIEFNETLATVDTLYDLAFLLMDLDHRRQRATANAVLNRYLWRTQDRSDLEALAALPVFLALRSAIRAMVGAQKAALSGDTLDAARNYLSEAVAYLQVQKPALVVVGGLSGTGKSTLAAALAPWVGRAPGAVHLRSDLERKALFGAHEFDRLGEAAYGEKATADVYAAIVHKTEAALAAGHSVIVDAVHALQSERAAMSDLAQRTGAKLHTFWLEAPPKVLIERVSKRKNDASDATPQVVERQLAYDLGELEWMRLDASGPLEGTLRTALSYLHASIDPP